MDLLVSLCKRRGFVFPSSEIYGGLGSVWDYGPLGTMLKTNIRREWMRRFVYNRGDIVPIESAVLTRREVLQASGHEEGFTDPLVECRKCGKRFRSDHYFEAQKLSHQKRIDETIGSGDSGPLIEGFSFLLCGDGGVHELISSEPKQFNLMFRTHAGPVESDQNLVYLRPETAQGMFVNFKLVAETMRMKPPFGIAQIGKAFRNEITPGNFIFRTREFEQAEIEYFVPPAEADEYFGGWLTIWEDFFRSLGLDDDSGRLRLRQHDKDELAHYSKATTDIEYRFPFGWSELAGVANRTDFDLKQHMEQSKQDLRWFDEDTKEKYLPHVIEPTLGIDRLMLALLVHGLHVSDGTDGREAGELVLKLHPRVAPVTAAVFPLMKKDGLAELAESIAEELRQADLGYVQSDEAGSIGKRYRRHDEIGTPFCVTVDYQSKEDGTVTVRHRDTLKQERVSRTELVNYLREQLG